MLSLGVLAAVAAGAVAEPGASSVIPLWADLSAVAVSALAGGLVAARERYDLNGVLFVAIATGLGGGIIRDLLIAQGPPLAMVSLWYLPTAAAAAAAGLLVFFLSGQIHALTSRARPVVFTLETIALALYTVLGTGKGLEAGAALLAAISQVVADIWLPAFIAAFIAAIIGLVVAVLARVLSVVLRWQTPPAVIVRIAESGESPHR